jgi:hypothetical protein
LLTFVFKLKQLGQKQRKDIVRR